MRKPDTESPSSTELASARDARVILHVDMDAFFASVEQLDEPALRGLPVLVGGRGRRGVVAAASYESRAFGCRSAMPMSMARALCPQAVIARPRFERYRQVSQELRAIFVSFTPLVEPLSLDEAFLDVTASTRLFGDGRRIAERIRARVRTELGLTCSVGVAPNKFVAKLASDLEKPDGLTVIEGDRVAESLAPLAISRMWGVGPVAAESFRAVGIETFGDLQRASVEHLVERFGEHGAGWRELAFGRDDRPVRTSHSAASMGHEQTFGEDLRTSADVEAKLLALADQVAVRLRRAGLRCTRITVKIRFGDYRTITRSTGLPNPSDRTSDTRGAARTLFRTWAASGFRPVRLIGCTATGLREGGEQLPLFAAESRERQRAVDHVADRIRERFGVGAIRRADIEGRDAPRETASERYRR